MHREIMLPKPRQEIDHQDGNGLNNQKFNLRICSHAQNMQSRGLPRNNKSGYKGVYWCKREKRWISLIGVGGNQKTLGRFFCIIRAAKAYDSAAEKYFGEFACTNFKK